MSTSDIIALYELLRVSVNLIESQKSVFVKLRGVVVLEDQVFFQCIVQNHSVFVSVFGNMSHTVQTFSADTLFCYILIIQEYLPLVDSHESGDPIDKF